MPFGRQLSEVRHVGDGEILINWRNEVENAEMQALGKYRRSILYADTVQDW